MPKIGRKGVLYIALPDSLATKAMPELKYEISINCVTPDGFQKKAVKSIDAGHEELQDFLKKFCRKQFKKMEDD